MEQFLKKHNLFGFGFFFLFVFTVTNLHKLSGLKQHKLTILQFWRPKWCGSYWVKSSCQQDCIPFLGALQENLFPCRFPDPRICQCFLAYGPLWVLFSSLITTSVSLFHVKVPLWLYWTHPENLLVLRSVDYQL